MAAREHDDEDTVWLMGVTGLKRRKDLREAARNVAAVLETTWKPSRAQRVFIRDCVSQRRKQDKASKDRGKTPPSAVYSQPSKCGKTVKSTKMPCLLRAGHRGRCRSKLAR